MATVHQGNAAKGIEPIPYPSNAGEVVAKRYTFAVTAAIAEAAADIIEMAPIPAGCVVADLVLDSDDLDSGTAAIKVDVGVMSGSWGVADNTRTCGAEFFSADTTPQGGGVARPTAKTAFRVARSDSDRSIGIKINTAADTGAAGTIGLTVFLAAG
jgi:hypothetical protein